MQTAGADLFGDGRSYLHIAGYVEPIDWVLVAVQVVVPLLLLLAVARARPRLRPVLIGTAVCALGLAMVVLFVVPDAWILGRFAVVQEGNGVRNLPGLFRLFHAEPFRTALVRGISVLAGLDDSVPVLAIGRLSWLAAGLGLVALGSAGAVLARSVAMGLLSALALGASASFAMLSGTDNPLPFTLAYSIGVWIALRVVLDASSSRGTRLLAGMPAILLQVLLFDLHPDVAFVWIPADAIVVVCLARGGTPGDLGARLRSGIIALWRWTDASRVRRVTFIVLVAVLAVAPWWAPRLPFLIWDQPRTSQQYPFLLARALWGDFLPGFLRMAAWTTLPLTLLAAAGLVAGIVRPVRLLGVAVAAAALLAAHEAQGFLRTDFVFVRWAAGLLPVLLLAALSAFGAASPRLRTAGLVLFGAATLASFVPPLLGVDEVAGARVLATTDSALLGTDNAREARLVARRLADRPDECVVMPVVAREMFDREELPQGDAWVRVLVGRADASLWFADRAAPDRIAAVAREVAAICPRTSLYLGLDCSLAGVSWCDALRREFPEDEGTVIDGPQYTSSWSYGRRDLPKRAGFFSVR